MLLKCKHFKCMPRHAIWLIFEVNWLSPLLRVSTPTYLSTRIPDTIFTSWLWLQLSPELQRRPIILSFPLLEDNIQIQFFSTDLPSWVRGKLTTMPSEKSYLNRYPTFVSILRTCFWEVSFQWGIMFESVLIFFRLCFYLYSIRSPFPIP